MSSGPDSDGTLVRSASLWLSLFIGVAIVLYVLFERLDVVLPIAPHVVALASAAVVTGLALFAVVVDRLVFTRHPEDLMTRQAPWVIVLVCLTIGVTAVLLILEAASSTSVILFALSIALPITMLLFVAVNVARYRTMEHGR